MSTNEQMQQSRALPDRPRMSAVDRLTELAIYTENPTQRAAIERVRDEAQDTNRENYVLGRPDASHLSESERAAFLRGWDAASEAVFRAGLRAALVPFQAQQS